MEPRIILVGQILTILQAFWTTVIFSPSTLVNSRGLDILLKWAIPIMGGWATTLSTSTMGQWWGIWTQWCFPGNIIFLFLMVKCRPSRWDHIHLILIETNQLKIVTPTKILIEVAISILGVIHKEAPTHKEWKTLIRHPSEKTWILISKAPKAKINIPT